jgi:hypothetical protein
MISLCHAVYRLRVPRLPRFCANVPNCGTFANLNPHLLRSLCNCVIAVDIGIRIGRLTLTQDHRFRRLGFSLSGGLKIIPKKIDNRHSPRRACDTSAWIRAEGSLATQQCKLLDISPTGVGLAVVDARRIPDKFILLLSKNGSGPHANVRWRRSTQIGAEFSAGDDLRPNYMARIADNVTKLRELLRR